MDALFVKESLKAKYQNNSVCLTEVKTGDSISRFRIMDFVAIKKTWTPITIKVFEVKVSRQDFLNDTKWRDYLDYGHQVYFVCPKGLIAKDELPQEAGLLYVYPSGVIRMQKEAPRRGIENFEKIIRMLLYILFWRTEDNGFAREMLRDQIKNYLADKIEFRQLGQLLSSKMATKLCELEEQKNELTHDVEIYKRSSEFARMMKNALNRQCGIRTWKKSNSEIVEATIKAIKDNSLDQKNVARVLSARDELNKLCSDLAIEVR